MLTLQLLLGPFLQILALHFLVWLRGNVFYRPFRVKFWVYDGESDRMMDPCTLSASAMPRLQHGLLKLEH